MEAPGVPGTKLIHEWLKIEIRGIRQEADRQDALGEHIVQNGFRLHVREVPFFEILNLAREQAEVILEPEHRVIDFGTQMEACGVLAVERYQVPAKDHVVADKNGEPRAQLYG